MKKIFTVFLLLIICYAGKAQNNLQFNRVVILKADSIVISCSSGCADTILYRTFTVPTDKVLKIESINFIAGNYLLFLDGVPFSKVSTSITNTFPIWLPSGTYSLYFSTYVTSASSTGNYAFLMSALEFNVIP